jgi:sulfoxide reductase catalytic subunit YedY
MLVRRRRGWEIPERSATSEAVAMGRRRLLGGAAGAAVLAGAGGAAEAQWRLLGGSSAAKEKPLTPLTAARNARYQPGRAITDEKDATHYNNFYEFGTDKDIAAAAQALVTEPWTIRIEGMVEKPRTIGFDDLMKQMTLEERVYRHRCVEAWAMTVPWDGFPLAAFVKLAAPLSGARFIEFKSLADDKTMPGLAGGFYSWPYTEGCTIDEAMNELAFLSVGMYGKTLPAQDGAPIRLTLPWKYGFKSAKSIVRVAFTDKRPVSFWEAIQPDEYGFWANVNPAVPHPRWSQARERLLGSDEMVPTVIWNGYGEFVAALYADKMKERLFV